MGRIGSWYGIVEAIILLMVTGVIGIAAQILSIQLVVISGVLMMFVTYKRKNFMIIESADVTIDHLV